jgi:undecaprenyl-diphosphatase
MLNRLLNLDRAVFLVINGAHNRFTDGLMTTVTTLGDAKVLIPLAALVFAATFKKRTWPFFLLIAITLAASDGAAHGLKILVQRVRPSHVLPNVHILQNYRGGLYGFPSNHAANSFALAAVLGYVWRKWRWRLLSLAGLIGYSRVYLGVHYPGDVLGGAILGSLIAWLILLLYGKLTQLSRARKEEAHG